MVAAAPAELRPPSVARDRTLSVADRVALVVLNLVVLIPGIHVSLIDRDEGWYGQVAREMAASGDWIVPTYLGEPWLGKPPLLYWLVAPLFHLFGRQEWIGRAVSVVAMTLAVQLLLTLGTRWFNRRTALVAAVAFSTAAMPVALGKLLVTDALLLLWVLAAVVALERLSTGQFTWRRVFGLGICCGLGVLTKGPPVALYLGGFALALVFAQADRRWVRDARTWLALPIALLVAAPWYLAVAERAAGTLWSQLFVYEFLARFTAPTHGHVGPPGYYIITSLGGWLPWTVLIPGALVAAWQAQRADRHVALAFWWFAIPWIVLELVPGKLPHYVLPCYAPIALMLGWLWDRGLDQPLTTPQRRALVLWLAVPLLLAAISAVLAVLSSIRGTFGDFSPAIRNPAAGILLTACAAAIPALVGLAALRRGRLRFAFGACAAIMVGVQAAAGFVLFPQLEPSRLSRNVANAANALAKDGETVWASGFDEPTSFFYLDAPARVLSPREFLAKTASGDLVGVAIVSESIAREWPPAGVWTQRSGFNYVRGRRETVYIGRVLQVE